MSWIELPRHWTQPALCWSLSAFCCSYLITLAAPPAIACLLARALRACAGRYVPRAVLMDLVRGPGASSLLLP